MKSLHKHQMGAVFGALSLGLAAGVSAQPMAAAPFGAGALPGASAPLASPSAAFELGASAQPTAAPARAPISRPPPTAVEPPRSALPVQVEASHGTDLARRSLAAGLNNSTANPAFEVKAHPLYRRPPSPTVGSLTTIAGATKRNDKSIVNAISRIIPIIPNP